MADDVEGAGHPTKDLSIAVAEDHPSPVPERIRVLLAEVHDPAQGHSGVVDRVALEELVEEGPGLAEAVVGLVDGLVARRLVAFLADDVAPDILLTRGIADRPVRLRLRRLHGQGVGTLTRATSSDLGVLDPGQANRVIAIQRPSGPGPLPLIPLNRDALQNERRENTVQRVTVTTHENLPTSRPFGRA